jgi:hypothetical protein
MRLPALLLLCAAVAAGCGSSGAAAEDGQTPPQAAADADKAPRVATRCPPARRLDVAGTFEFHREKAPEKTEPETTLSCAYRSGPQGGDAYGPTALITFLVGDYGDGVDENFEAMVDLTKCSESDEVDPTNCTTDIDERYSRYERTDDFVEGIEVDEPLGEGVPNPDKRFGVFSSVYKSGPHICATSVLQSTSASDEPQALAELGENVIGVVRAACGR